MHAQHATDAEIFNMASILADAEKDCGSVIVCNEYHRCIYVASRNRYLLATLQSIIDLASLLGASALDSPDRALKAMKEHFSILEAIKSRDVQGAAEAARIHVRNALAARISMLRYRSIESAS